MIGAIAEAGPKPSLVVLAATTVTLGIALVLAVRAIGWDASHRDAPGR